MSANNLKFVLLVFVLTALSFNHAFNFHLFYDDWIQNMGALYYPGILLYYARVHPGTALEFKILSHFFQFNPFPWQFFGFLLKVAGALSILPFVYALTNSKRIALYACLIFAVFGVGIEAFVWASGSSSALVIPLINIGFYFWIISEKDRLDRNFSIALLLFALSILAEPGRAFMVIVLAAVWECLSLYQQINMKKLRVSVLKFFLFFSLAPLIYSILKNLLQVIPEPSFLLQQSLPVFKKNPIDLYKNLLFGWTLLPKTYIGLLTIAFFIIIFLCLFLFITKKGSSYKNIIFLSLWSLLFFIANSIRNDVKGEPVESRYYALSAVGVVGLLAYGFFYIKTRYINELLALFLIFNLFVTNNILLQMSGYRSTQIFNKIWNKVDQDVPKDEVGSVFMFTAINKDPNIGKILEGSGSNAIPFSAKRKIIIREDQPFVTDKNLIAWLVCNKGTQVLNPLVGIIYKDQIPLSHVHAWELKNGELENRSEQERDGIKKLAKCLQNIN